MGRCLLGVQGQRECCLREGTLCRGLVCEDTRSALLVSARKSMDLAVRHCRRGGRCLTLCPHPTSAQQRAAEVFNNFAG